MSFVRNEKMCARGIASNDSLFVELADFLEAQTLYLLNLQCALELHTDD